MDNESIISTREAMRLTGLGRTTIWKLEREGRFPRKRQLSDRRVGYLRMEVTFWIGDRQPARQDEDE